MDSSRWTYSQRELDSALIDVFHTGKNPSIAAALINFGAHIGVVKDYVERTNQLPEKS